MVSEKEVLKALESVMDPELGLSIVDLGLIYGIQISGSKVHVKMTLTNPMCPMQSYLVGNTREAIEKIAGKGNAKVELVWEPEWNHNRLSPKARKKLGL
ncbi:MAG: metal-sulfur cluster assembly factor [Candidatus Diapherotrites archaeon]